MQVEIKNENKLKKNRTDFDLIFLLVSLRLAKARCVNPWVYLFKLHFQSLVFRPKGALKGDETLPTVALH